MTGLQAVRSMLKTIGVPFQERTFLNQRFIDCFDLHNREITYEFDMHGNFLCFYCRG